VVVVQVDLGDAVAEEFDGGGDAGVVGDVGISIGFGGQLAEVEVAEVEADADLIEVAGLEDVEEVLGGGDFVLQVFQQEADAERRGEGLEVLDGGEGIVDGGLVPGGVLEAEVEDDVGEGDLFGALDGALDLVHGGDAGGAFRWR
jgi:hypothetical protein